MADSGADRSGDTMRERVPGSRARLWLLLQANRWTVAGAILGAVFASLVVLGAADPAPLRSAVRSSDPIETLFQALLTGVVTGVTLVVTINQLVLSQELGPLGDQRERMSGAMSFREDVEEVLDVPVTPAEPSAFLRTIVDHARTRAEGLADAAAGVDDQELRETVEEYVDELVENARTAGDNLADAQFGTFAVVSAALDFNYSRKINEARRLRFEHDDGLPDETLDALDEMIEILVFFGPAREHVKTLYFEWELVDLSRAILYAAVPAIVVAAGAILYLDDPRTIVGTTLGVDNLVWVVSAGTTVALAPFAILVAYVLRIATVAKRTLAIGPFVLRTAGGDGDRGDD